MPLKKLPALIIFIFSFLSAQAQCPPNIDFETGTLYHWNCFTGTPPVGGCCPISTPTSSGPVLTRHTIVSGSATDPYGGFPVVCPLGGKYSLKLGNDDIGAQAERVRFYLHIPPNATNYILTFNYAVVLQNPNHSPSEQPRFEVNAYDSATGDPIPCVQFSFVASSVLPGFLLSPNPGAGEVWYKPWSRATVNLKGHSNSTIALDFATGDCSLGGHFGYAYVDMSCSLFSASSVLCSNSSNTIKLIGPPGFEYYKWMDSSLTTYYGSGETVTIGKPNGINKFAVIVTPYAGYGCPDTLYTQTAVSNTSLAPRHDTTVCFGTNAPVRLYTGATGASAPFTYSWTPTTGLSCNLCDSPIATVTSTTEYYFTVRDSNNCPRSDSIKISVTPPINVTVHIPSDSICQFEHAKIYNVGINDSNAYYGWGLGQAGNFYGPKNTDTVTVRWDSPGQKTITLNLQIKPCFAIDSTTIYVKPGPLASFEVNLNPCVNTPVNLQAKEQDAFYYWTIDDNYIRDTTYQSSIPVSWYQLGKKKIALKTVSTNGCVSEYDTTVTVHEYPKANIVAKALSVCKGDTVYVSTEDAGHASYEWEPQAFFLENNVPSTATTIEGNTLIALKVTSLWGCTAVDTQTISVANCCNIYFPNAFTPNGDGYNDKFHILSNGNFQIHTFIVMDRRGKKVFETQNPTDGWDGSFNGMPLDLGTYFYYVKYICNGNIIEKKGDFLLIR